MTKYVCTCGASHTSFDWDDSTTEFYGPGCISISDEASAVHECVFVCPSCGKELDGGNITEVEDV